MRVRWRVRLSCLELTRPDGRVECVPWTAVAVGDLVITAWAHRREKAGATTTICAGKRAARIARRLSHRARWRVADSPLAFPSSLRLLLLTGFLGLILTATMAVGAVGMWYKFGTKYDPALEVGPDVGHIALLIALLTLIGGILYGAVPLVAVMPYLAFRRREPQWVAMHVRPDVLVCRRADGAETSFAWSDVITFDGLGRIVFASCPERPVQILPFENPTWRLVYRQLKRLRPQAQITSAMRGGSPRVLTTVFVTALLAEALFFVVAPTLGTTRRVAGVFIGFAIAYGLGVSLTRYFERRAAARSRRPTGSQRRA